MTSESTDGKRILREAKRQNPSVALRLSELKRKADIAFGDDHIEIAASPRVSFVRVSASRRGGIIFSLIGIVAIGIAVGPPVYDLFCKYWREFLLGLGCACVGAGSILLIRRVGDKPLSDIRLHHHESREEPLSELEYLARRSASRLRSAYRIQAYLVCAISMVFIGVVYWSILMVAQRRLEYGVSFGSGGVGMLILSMWKWQPFDRMSKARKLADDADVLATGLRLRIKSISEIKEPEMRADAEWRAVQDYLSMS